MDSKSIFSPLGASNHSKEERQPEDFYATDHRAAGHIFEAYPKLKECKSIVEPCAGDGTMVDAIEKIVQRKIDSFDLIPRRPDIVEQDYFKLNIKDKYDLIITNPPYRRKSKDYPGLVELILKMLDDVQAGGYVVLLLKTLHLESQERYNKIYSTMPPERIFVYAPRISCYKNNDLSLTQGAISYSWFVWHKTENGDFLNKPVELSWISTL